MHSALSACRPATQGQWQGCFGVPLPLAVAQSRGLAAGRCRGWKKGRRPSSTPPTLPSSGGPLAAPPRVRDTHSLTHELMSLRASGRQGQ